MERTEWNSSMTPPQKHNVVQCRPCMSASILVSSATIVEPCLPIQV